MQPTLLINSNQKREVTKMLVQENFQRQKRNQRVGGAYRFKVSAFLLAVVLLIQNAYADPLLKKPKKTVEDEQLGQILPNNPSDLKTSAGAQGSDEDVTVAGEVDKNYVPILPFTAYQQRRKSELEQLYPDPASLRLDIDSIEPAAGPTTGDTRVLVRGGPFEELDLLYPSPKCKFGANHRVVSATYVKCTQRPITMEDQEGKNKAKNFWCLQCDNSPAVKLPKPVQLSISLTGDFDDSEDSIKFTYYEPTVVTAIYPRYGPKDGGTVVQVWGENFRSFGDDLRCNFGSKSVIAKFINGKYLTCKAPFSDVVNKPITFSISMNKQQNSRQLIDYWYYQHPHIAKLDPNYGPDSGGNTILVMGANLNPFMDETIINNANDTFCVFTELNNKMMPATLINSTKLTCEVPPAYGNISMTYVDVTLNNQNYTEDYVPYYYYKPPKIYNMIPKEGPTKGGTDVRIFATEFKKNKHIICIFGETRTRGKLISTTEVECISPPHQPPESVPVAVTYEEDGDKSKSNSLPFLYYETPIVLRVEPPCGPTYGLTQIKVIGKNFVDMGFGRAMCIFNNTRYMNTTILNSETIICQTPSLSRFETLLPQQDMMYHVTITLNGIEATPTYALFAYYHEPEIRKVVNSAFGPISGGTTSTLVGRNFLQRNLCNLKVRYGALEVNPKRFNDTHLETISPMVSASGAVTLSPSGNGQNYAKDYILHFRDVENTFTYYQDIFIHDLHPQSGPTTGKTRVVVKGIGLKQFRNDDGSVKNVPLFVKLVDLQGSIIGNITQIDKFDNDQFVFYTPKARDGTKAILMVSFNKQNWQAIIPTEKTFSYLYYNAPIVTAIDPHFGPVKNPKDEKAIITGFNFDCPQNDCSNCVVRFGDIEFGTIVPGKVLSSNQIEVYVPKYTKPDILAVEVSMNGFDFTNDHVTYGFFDAFVLSVTPKLIVKRGGTTLTVRGFGFVNSEAGQLKGKFGSKHDSEMICASPQCITDAKFIDKNTLTTVSFPQRDVNYSNNTNIGPDGMTVEVSVYNGQFTTNEFEVYYIYDPEYISINRKSASKNLQVPILVETDFHWENNDIEKFIKYANFTCRFTVGDEVKVTRGRMESMPLGASYHGKKVLPTHVICPSAKMENIGIGKLHISPNAQDYLGDGFTFEFTPPADIYRIAPQSGPKENECKVKLIGGGFKEAKDTVYAKIGNFDLEPIAKERVIAQLWSLEDYLGSMLMIKNDLRTFRMVQRHLDNGDGVQTVWSRAPEAPHSKKTPGGPVFVTAGQVIELDVASDSRRLDGEATSSLGTTSDRETEAPSTTTSLNTTSDKESEVASEGSVAKPNNSTTAPAKPAEQTVSVLLSHEKDQKTLGSKSSPAALKSKPGDRYIFTESPVEYYYYHQPVVKKVEPTSGLASGGTPIEISGAWFNEKLEYGVIPYCMIGDKIIRARFYSTVRIVCVSPPNDNTSVALPVKVSLNGVDFVDSGFTFSYYVQPELYSTSPRSGPMIGGTDIFIYGSHFSNITDPENVKCKFTLYDSERVVRPKFMPVTYVNETYVICMSPNGFKGGEKVHIQMTFNGEDYTPINDKINFRYYVIFGSFPRAGPADGFDQHIVITGSGLTTGDASTVMCNLNNTAIKPWNISDNIILCPMCLPTKDPEAIGPVKFGLKFDGTWNDFGDFYYYKQITFDSLTPNFGPSEGEGELKMTGDNFRNDFPGVMIGCKIGESIGQGIMVEEGVIKCVVEEMDLVDEDEALVVQIALNSHSWVGGRTDPFLYRPYGITAVMPNSGPYEGYTDVMVAGKGFTEDIAHNARCKFGTDGNYAVVGAEVLDYTRLVCRSPADFMLPENADEQLSVPFGIAFGEEENKPWTKGTWRYRFYTQPAIERANPEEVKIGRFAEIYLYAYEGDKFFEPVPQSKNGDTTGILCNFEDFGTSIGMYVNETTLLCVTPHIKGHPEDYYRETVQVTVAMNGQDFNEIQSDAFVTFVGQGSDGKLLYFIIASLLIALLIIACYFCCASLNLFRMNLPTQDHKAYVVSLRDGSGTTRPRASLDNYGLGNRARTPNDGRRSGSSHFY